MPDAPAIALVGDFDPQVIAHAAIPRALELAGQSAGGKIKWRWVATDSIHEAARDLGGFAAVWVVPASPYRNPAGVLDAIRFARETGRPFLGTCGGFQHLLIEYARNVCGAPDADHEETAQSADSSGAIPCSYRNIESHGGPPAPILVVTRLACSLVEKSGHVTFTPGSHLHGIFGGRPTTEGYHCSFGLNPAWRTRLEAGGIRSTMRRFQRRSPPKVATLTMRS